MVWGRRLKITRRDELPDTVRVLLILRANGAISRLNHIGSDFWFSFERVSGSDKSAVMALRIPRLEQTVTCSDGISEAFTQHGYQLILDDDNPSLVGHVLISVDDIWAKASGAQGAHAARILLDSVGIPSEAKFRLVEFGDPSKRALQNKKFLENG